jgi:hypothetical protein
MPNLTQCPSSTMVQLQACVLAGGGPGQPQNLTGEGSPEGVVQGFWTGLDEYFDTEAEILYRYNGTVGATTGWVAINP